MTRDRAATLVALWLASSLTLAASCTAARTEIVVRIDTDMTQGAGGTLTAIAVRVLSMDETTPRFDQQFDLGVGATPLVLPKTLGVVPRDATQDRRLEVQVDAIHGGAVLFTRRAIATFAQGRTLQLDVFLADRCRQPENRNCPVGFSCGATGCEAIEHMTLPELGTDGGGDPRDGAIDAPRPDASSDAGSAGNDADSDAGSDAGSDAFTLGDAGCGATWCGTTCVDLTSDMLNCGTCGVPCGPVTNGTATCRASACRVSCSSGFVERGGACVGLAAPRLLAPASMGRTSTRRPTLRWDLPVGATGAHVEICADPACATVETSFDAVGTSGAPAVALNTSPSIVHHVRLFARTGAVTGTTASPTWTFAVPFADAPAQTSWPRLFDTDLDGHDEVALGEPSAAAVSIYAGTATGPVTTAALRLTGPVASRFGASVAHAGDVNGDGYADLVVGAPSENAAYLYLGSAGGIAGRTRIAGAALSELGASVAGAGDIDGDGFGDLIVGAPGTAQALVFRGSPDGIAARPDFVLSGAAGSRFGAAVASAGDVDGDGFGDVVVGAPMADAAFVHRGAASGLAASAIALSGAAGSRFGTAVGGGDVAGLDGMSDVIIGAPATRSVIVFAGAATGLDATADFTMTGTLAEAGRAVAVADIDLNGYEDVAVGTAGELVDVYLSNSSGPGVRAGWNQHISPIAGAMGFGRSLVVSLVDGGRYFGVVVGSPLSGRAYWCAGHASGALTADVALTSASPGSDLGSAVACSGVWLGPWGG